MNMRRWSQYLNKRRGNFKFSPDTSSRLRAAAARRRIAREQQSETSRR